MKHYIGLNKTLLLVLMFANAVNAQDESILRLEESLESVGVSLDIESSPEALDLREWTSQVPNQDDNYLYEDYLHTTQEWQESFDDSEVELPAAEELVSIALRYQSEGMSALDGLPFFQQEQSDEEELGHTCNTYIPAKLFSLAEYYDPENNMNLKEQLMDAFSTPVHNDYTIENIIGEDWVVQADFEDDDQFEFIDNEDHYFLEHWIDDTFEVYQQQESEDEPFASAPVLYHHLPDTIIIKAPIAVDRSNISHNQLNKVCENLALIGADPFAWYKYEKHPEFTFHYQLCGENGISSDAYENVTNKVYLMPNWSTVHLEKCKDFTKTCAPMHIQMMAADILYQRQILGNAGFKLPNHWNIEVVSNNPINGASAFLGTIKLNGPARSARGMRGVMFHEYFHAIETMYGSEWDFLGNGNLLGSAPSIRKNTAWWSQLESLADWVIDAISLGDNPWPTYYHPNYNGISSVSDARNHLLESNYHPLEYGYLAERYSQNGNDKVSLCQGCDSIKLYLEILNGEPYGARLWQQSYIALHTFIEMKRTGIRPTTGYQLGSLITFNKFLQDYHLDLLFSRMSQKWVSTSGDFRFLNRSAPKQSILWPELTEWPPAIQNVPTNMMSLFGKCSDENKPLIRYHATQVGAQYINGFTCDMRISPTGAIYLEIPLDNSNLPDKIKVSGVGVKLHDEDINARFRPRGQDNFRIKPGELINGNLRIFTVPAELTASNTLDFNETKALSLYGNMAVNNSYTISLKNHQPTSNRLYIIIDYPFLSPEWLKAPNGPNPQRENFMARFGIVAYWNN